MKQKRNLFAFFSAVWILCLALSGCSSQERESSDSPASDAAATAAHATDVPSDKGTRDNAPHVLVPEASGQEVYSCDVALIDVSNAEEGYIMADYSGTNSKVKLQLTGPDGVTYTYNLHPGSYEVFPLTAGDGAYMVSIFENIGGTKYSLTISADLDVTVANSFGPYLYPNQYVNFSADSLPVEKAAQLAYSADTDLEVVELIYNYIIDSFTYDYDKAATVVSGYLPVVDEIFLSNTGICFDYAAVMATMLRSQNIPTRLEVGYMGEEYHAWISVYIEDMGWINGIIEFNGTSWNLMDPTFASASRSPKKFITENSKYLTKYVY